MTTYFSTCTLDLHFNFYNMMKPNSMNSIIPNQSAFGSHGLQRGNVLTNQMDDYIFNSETRPQSMSAALPQDMASNALSELLSSTGYSMTMPNPTLEM